MWLEASCQPTWCCMITENIAAAAKRHLHFLFGMLAVLILRRSRLLRFNSLQQSKQTPSQQMHKTPAHDHPKRLPLANWKNTFGKLTVVKLPANTSFKCVQTVLSLVQLLFVLWQLLLHALLFSSQPQMLAASCLSALLVSFRYRGIEGFIHLTALIHSMKPAVWRLVLLKHQDYHPLVIYIPIFGLPSALGYSATQHTQYNSWKCMCCKQKYVRVAQHNVTGSFLHTDFVVSGSHFTLHGHQECVWKMMKNVICASERTNQPRLQLNCICTSCSTCLRWSLWACAASCDSITFFFETNTLTTDAQDTSPWPPQTPPTCKLKKHIRKIDSCEIAGQYLFQVCSNSPELGATAVCTLTTAAQCFAFLFSTSNA